MTSLQYFNKSIAVLLGIVFTLLLHTQHAHAQPLSVCDYTPAQSLFLDVNMAFNGRAINNPGDFDPIINGTSKIDLFSLLDIPTFGFTGEASFDWDFIDSSRNNLSISPNFKYFLGDSNDLFLFFGGPSVQGVSFTLDTFLDELIVSAPSGWGYGRFRDVTPFAKAIEIQNQLSRLGKLEQPFDQKVLERIAQLIDDERPDTPLSQLVNELQETIETAINRPEVRDLNAQDVSVEQEISNGTEDPIRLEAVSLLAIEKILQDNTSSKFCGWEVSGGIEVQPGLESLFNLYLVSFKYAVAPASRSQLLMDTKLSFSPNIFSSKRGTFFLDAQMTYNYRVTDSINAQGRYVFLRSSEQGNTPIDIQALNVLLQMNLNSSVGISIDTSWSKASGTSGWSRSVNIDLNVGFEFF